MCIPDGPEGGADPRPGLRRRACNGRTSGDACTGHSGRGTRACPRRPGSCRRATGRAGVRGTRWPGTASRGRAAGCRRGATAACGPAACAAALARPKDLLRGIRHRAVGNRNRSVQCRLGFLLAGRGLVHVEADEVEERT